MKNNYLTVGACVFLSCMGIDFTQAQSTGPEFLDCSSAPISLCVSDDGVRLPSNNKIYLGEENPDATSCSVQVSQKTKVRSTCGKSLQYEVQLFLEEDSTTAIVLLPLTSITTDSLSEAELSFDSELSPDSLISKKGLPYTIGCNAYHKIKWIVTDSCGHTESCEQLIKLYDCQAPLLTQPNFPFTLTVPIGCVLNVFAKDLVLDVLDDCTLKTAFLFSLKEDNYQPDTSYNACDIPAYGVELPVDIWIADKGIDTDCNGTIDWTERNRYKNTVTVVYGAQNSGCLDCGSGDVLIAGTIETEDVQAVEKVHVTLTTPGLVFPTYVTGKNGKFSFNGIVFPAEYTLSAERNDNHRNGVSTLDIVRIQKHLLGKEPFSSPYDLIAADANNSHSVSAIDMVEIRKLILGIYTEFPANKSWRFVPKDYVFGDTLQPGLTPEGITFNSNNIPNLDFVGIKIGDVNNSVQPNAQTIESRNDPPKIIWSLNQIKYSPGDIIDINFYVDDPQTIQGFQFTVSDPDLQFIGISAGTMDLTEENIGLFNDKMTLSWFNEDGYKPVKGDILFTIKAIAKRNGEVHENLSINSDITEAEQYGMNDEIFTPVLRSSESKSNDHIILFAPEPNPWSEKTIIPFYIKDPERVTLKIFEPDGKLIYEKQGIYEKGNNEITVTSSDFTSRGLMYYTLKTAGFSSTQKMIVLD